MASNSVKKYAQQQQTEFDTVNNILNIQNTSQPNSKNEPQPPNMQQLHNLCKELIATNKQLNEQIDLLKEELQNKSAPSTQNVFNDEYSQIQLDFTEIEQNIKDYRNELQRYQNQITQQLKDKNTSLEKMKEDAAREQEKIENQRLKINQLQNQRFALIQTNNSLLAEMKASIKASNKYDSPRSIRKSNDYKDYGYFYQHPSTNINFNANIQQQLEKLIEKLIRQLQHERYLKKKLNDENKRLQNGIVELQRQLIHKNNKIYELQISIIKNTKQNIGNNHYNREGSPRGHNRQASKLTKISKTFTYMELINGQIQINVKQKLIVALKTIDFYIRKIENEDFTSHILESVAICNYTPINPNLITIKADRTMANFQEDYDQTEAQVVWNLAFLLDNLFNHEQSKNFGEIDVERDIIDFLNQILENRSGNTLSTIFQLRKMVQDGINCRK